LPGWDPPEFARRGDDACCAYAEVERLRYVGVMRGDAPRLAPEDVYLGSGEKMPIESANHPGGESALFRQAGRCCRQQ